MEVLPNFVKDPPDINLFDVTGLPTLENKCACKMIRLDCAGDAVSLLDARGCVLKVVFKLAKVVLEKGNCQTLRQSSITRVGM